MTDATPERIEELARLLVERPPPPEHERSEIAGHLRRLARLERVLREPYLEIAPDPLMNRTSVAEAWSEESDTTKWASGHTPLAALLALADALDEEHP